jgi:hypothetical protein
MTSGTFSTNRRPEREVSFLAVTPTHREVTRSSRDADLGTNVQSGRDPAAIAALGIVCLLQFDIAEGR